MGRWEPGERDVEKEWGPGLCSILVFSYCILNLPLPKVWSALSSLASELEQFEVGGGLCAVGSPWWCSVPLRRLGEARGCVWGGGRLGLCIPAYASFFCFVLSGPRLRPWQKENRKPTKVSPLALGWRPWTSHGLGGEAQFVLYYVGGRSRGAGIWGSGKSNINPSFWKTLLPAWVSSRNRTRGFFFWSFQ